MEIYGRIIPENWEIEIEPIELIYDDPLNKKTFQIELQAEIGQFKASVNGIKKDDNIAIHLAIVRVVEIVKAKADLIGFQRGIYLHVILDGFTVEGQNKEVALSERRALDNLEFPKQPEEVEFCEQLILSDVNLRLAMSDLVASLGTLNYSAIAAARVLDFIRRTFSSINSEKAQ